MPRKGQFISHCKRGHARIPENMYSDRACKLCARIRNPEKVARILAKQKANPAEHALRVRLWTATPSGKRSVRNSKLKQYYGITLDEYERLLVSQDGECAICVAPLDSSRTGLIPAVDHVHNDTKRIRGLLCSRCNKGLGHFRDSIKLLRRAADYLRHFEGSK